MPHVGHAIYIWDNVLLILGSMLSITTVKLFAVSTQSNNVGSSNTKDIISVWVIKIPINHEAHTY